MSRRCNRTNMRPETIARHDQEYRTLRRQLAQGSRRPTDLSAGERGRFVLTVKRKVERDLERIAQLVNAGENRKAERAQAKHIDSFHARFAAATAKFRARGVSGSERFSLVYRYASQLGSAARSGEIRPKDKIKNDGRRRRVWSFRLLDKMQQYLLGTSLTPFYGMHHGQYAHHGRTCAVRALASHIEASDDRHVIMHADVTDFYDNVSPEWVRESIPLPQGLIEWCLHTGYAPFSQGMDNPARQTLDEDCTELGRRGLPQGSALSPFAAEFVIAGVVQSSPLRDLPFVNYSDNFAVVVPSGEATRLQTALQDAFNKHPAGPFHLKVSVKTVWEENRFLGYRLRRSESGSCEIYVEELDYTNRFSSLCNQLEHARPRDVPNLLDKMTSYCSAFELWPEHGDLRLAFKHTSVRILQERNLSYLIPEHFKNAPHVPDNSALSHLVLYPDEELSLGDEETRPRDLMQDEVKASAMPAVAFNDLPNLLPASAVPPVGPGNAFNLLLPPNECEVVRADLTKTVSPDFTRTRFENGSSLQEHRVPSDEADAPPWEDA